MARISRTANALLGYLSWGPMSGYDLKKTIDGSIRNFWSESYGQLYPTLNRLVEEGLAKKKLARRHEKRDRYLYSITPKGRREFQAWLIEASELPKVRDEFKLKLFLTAQMSPSHGIRLLEQYRSKLRERHEIYLDSEKILSTAAQTGVLPSELEWLQTEEQLAPVRLKRHPAQQALVFLLTLRSGILTLEAQLNWCGEAIAALKASSNPTKENVHD